MQIAIFFSPFFLPVHIQQQYNSRVERVGADNRQRVLIVQFQFVRAIPLIAFYVFTRYLFKILNLRYFSLLLSRPSPQHTRFCSKIQQITFSKRRTTVDSHSTRNTLPSYWINTQKCSKVLRCTRTSRQAPVVMHGCWRD